MVKVESLAEIKVSLQTLFDAGRFKEADTLFRGQTALDAEEYHELKAIDGVQPWLEAQLGVEVDDEKARILAHTGQNILVRARAGSGKTRLLTLKTILAVRTEEVQPDEVLILAFNRKAKEVILERIRKHIPSFETARTFHSLAYAIVLPQEDILKDDLDSESVTQSRSKFIADLLGNILAGALLKRFYDLYRRAEHEELIP